jgi:hypothetical protein
MCVIFFLAFHIGWYLLSLAEEGKPSLVILDAGVQYPLEQKNLA